MRIYPVLVFLHVLAAFVMLGAVGVEGVVLGGLERAVNTEEARGWGSLLRRNARAGGLAGLILLASGGWMMHQAWGAQGWLLASIAALVLLGAGGGISQRQLRPVLRALSSPSPREAAPLPHAVKRLLRFRIAMAITVVALMTLKPSPVQAWAVAAAGALLGALAATVPARPSRIASDRPEKVTGGA